MSLPNLDPSPLMDHPAPPLPLMAAGQLPMPMDTSPTPVAMNTMSSAVTSTVSSLPSLPMPGTIQSNTISNQTVGSVQSVGTGPIQSNAGVSPAVRLTPISNILNSTPASSGMGVKNQTPASSSSVQNNTSVSDLPAQLLSKARLQDLVREIDPTAQVDDEVEEMLMQLADDFVETCVTSACLLAKHRKASTIDVKDVQLHLERNWNMWIPGFGTDELRPYKRATVTEAHKQRLALIRKALKKY